MKGNGHRLPHPSSDHSTRVAQAKVLQSEPQRRIVRPGLTERESAPDRQKVMGSDPAVNPCCVQRPQRSMVETMRHSAHLTKVMESGPAVEAVSGHHQGERGSDVSSGSGVRIRNELWQDVCRIRRESVKSAADGFAVRCGSLVTLNSGNSWSQSNFGPCYGATQLWLIVFGLILVTTQSLPAMPSGLNASMANGSPRAVTTPNVCRRSIRFPMCSFTTANSVSF